MESNRFEPFFILKEFQSLDRYIDQHLLTIQEEEKRLKKLELLKSSRFADLEDHQNELRALTELSLTKEKLDYKLSRDWQQTLEAESSIKNNDDLIRLQKQKEVLKLDKEKLDSELYALMEKIEETEKLLADDQSFLAGIEKTIQDIKLEVATKCQEEKSKISDYETRQGLLLEQIPVHFKDKFVRIHKQLKGKRPITIARGNLCGECSFLLSRSLLADLDRGESLQTCPQCSRLLLPSTAS